MKHTLLTANNIIPVAEHTFACSSLTLDINESSVISMVGPQSSSKSIWLNTLMGFNSMAQGELTLLQHDVRKLNRPDWLKLQKEISYVGKDSALLSAYTLKENILLPALYHKLGSREELTKRLYSLLNELGFDDRDALNQLPAFVTPLLTIYTKIARALIVKPKLLFMTDIYTDISPGRTHNIKQFLKRQVENKGMSIVLTTSNLKQVIDDSDTFVFLSKTLTGVYESRRALIETSESSIKNYLFESGIH